jgi:hypothetical protein
VAAGAMILAAVLYLMSIVCTNSARAQPMSKKQCADPVSRASCQPDSS